MITSRTARPLLAALTWVVVVAGCDVYADPVDNGAAFGNVPSPVSSGRLSAPNGGASTQVLCPPARPLDNAQCERAGSVCEYGETPDVTCNPRIECVADTTMTTNGGSPLAPAWITDPTIGGCIVHTCPGTFAEITTGGSCSSGADAGDAAEYLCGYPEGLCGCSTGPDGAHAHARRWDCAQRPHLLCPAERPHIGQACASDGVTCDYGSCIFKHGTAVHCDSKTWQATEVPCN